MEEQKTTPFLTEQQILDLSQYLTSWSQGGTQITTLSANGVIHAGLLMGLTITDVNFTETQDGKGYEFCAEAENLNTGQKYKTYLFQSKLRWRSGGKSENDPDALAKGSKKVARNALRGLMPVEFYLERCKQAIADGRARESQLQNAQKIARSALNQQREAFESEFGLQPAHTFEIAQDRLGDPADWDLADWKEFTIAIQNLDGDWFGMTVQEEDKESLPAPETDTDADEESSNEQLFPLEHG